MNKSRAVFLDRDGTINREAGYLSDVRNLYIYPNAGKALTLLSNAGFKIVVVTNQSGVGRGLVKKKELDSINSKIKEIFAGKGARIDAFYVCPHHPDDNCDCRKPKTGLLKKASRDLNLDLSSSYIIGDKLTDIEMGRKAGLKNAILVLTGFGRKEQCMAKQDGFRLGPVCRDVFSAAKLILRQSSVSNLNLLKSVV